MRRKTGTQEYMAKNCFSPLEAINISTKSGELETKLAILAVGVSSARYNFAKSISCATFSGSYLRDQMRRGRLSCGT